MMTLNIATFLTHLLAETIQKRLEIPHSILSAKTVKSPASSAGKNLSDVSRSDLHAIAKEVCVFFRSFEKSFRYTFDPDRLCDLACEQLNASESRGAHILLASDPYFPETLRAASDHPLALFAVGNPSVLNFRKIAIIGSRKANRKALLQSFLAGGVLAELGIAVTSGGAFGCDIAAHEGVLSRKSKSSLPAICVFAAGLQEFYPRSNIPVFEEIEERGGLLLTEKLWGEPCLPRNFPTRNRIICGLSDSILLMQAAVRSGSMISARIAAQEGRDVFVLTHDEGDVTAEGSFRLIEEGASAFDDIEDIVHAFC